MSTRSFNKYFLLGTMALTGMVGFTACSSDDMPDNGKQNPTYNNGTVKTQFALNVPQSGRNSRMTAGNTQQAGQSFLGMSDMRMFSFGATVEPGIKVLNQISLGTSDNAFESDENRRIYRDVIVPVGTKNFVFYGTATTSGSDNHAHGKLNRPTWGNVTDLANVEFSLDPIDANVNLGTSAEGEKIIDQLNTVLTAEYNGKEWSAASGTSTDQFEKQAAKLYASFIKLRAGSYASVKSTLETLIKAAGKTSGTTYTNDYEYLLADIATKAQAAIDALDADNDVIQFPCKYGLPDGVAQVDWDAANNKFKAVVKDQATFTEENRINYGNITYPATLDYTVNTPVKANDNVLTGLSDWPDKDKWSKNDATIWGSDQTTWKDEVSINSRSIALKNAVQYAVATLATTVQMKSSMNDNGKASGLVADNTLYATNGNVSNFWLTGILIGGQPSKVGWDYKATSTTGAEFDYAIYDNDLNEGVTEGNKKVYKLKETVSSVNYTLVLDNNKDTQESVVYVTLELVNKSGSDFYGKDGVVPNGGTFYLVGKLDLTKVTTTEKLNRIFLQDYKTKAAFTINSLKNAYNCIPDLRSSSISVGLAVDLTWEEGLSFTDEIN